MASPVKPADRRSRPPELILAWEVPASAVTLMDRPPFCRCTWVPWFYHTTVEVPGKSGQPVAVACWQQRGFTLKFSDRDCPVRAHVR